MVSVQQTLQNVGLEGQEVKIYLALLDLGESTATKIAERAAVERVHTYQIINKVIEKGLASYVVKNNVKYFSAAEPEILLTKLQEKEEELKKLLPVLKDRQKNTIPETKVELYRGREGINTLLRTVLKDKPKTYYLFGGAEEACSRFNLEWTIFVKQAEKQKIRGKILARKKDTFFIGTREDYVFVPEQLVSSSTQLLWNKKTVIFVWTEPAYAILINNEEITKSNLATFNHLWNTGETPTKKDKEKRALLF